MAIKHKDFDKARGLLNGKFAPFLTNAEGDPQSGEDLAYALKIVINIVYGLTSASFENPFRDNRNKDNIVAKRGALFMIDLKHAVQERGYQVVHIKTDSIKIPISSDAPKGGQEIVEFIENFGKEYGYDFELEGIYQKFCLVNDAVYIARQDDDWNAVGAQFQKPYVYKTLFTGKPIEFEDLCEVRNVTKGTIYLDTSGTGEVERMVHIGRTGVFVPVQDRGGELYRVDEGKVHAVTGTKGYKWVTRDMAANREMTDDLFVDMQYFDKMVVDAQNAIEKFGSYADFVA